MEVTCHFREGTREDTSALKRLEIAQLRDSSTSDRFFAVAIGAVVVGCLLGSLERSRRSRRPAITAARHAAKIKYEEGVKEARKAYDQAEDRHAAAYNAEMWRIKAREQSLK